MDKQQDPLRRLGERLASRRRQKNLSLAQLATLTGVSGRDIAAVEAGELDPTITMLVSLARGLGLSPSELLSPE
ncbi:MAG TPA: helix-turn-helix transcriptional regulator [Puia sp.]|uniref:helix-turn-helix domain-containing protein n=1 Tax=Puia sp. TaxID=2045100 RepID=UPI002C188489|nr:helix-turn-helix transcriptional regulator [Puia sp.]HVU98243.1 helix-turn-helix transcriptional regulator [Puia sp.]